MNLEDSMKESKLPLYPKDIVNQTFLLDPKTHVTKRHVQLKAGWKNDLRYEIHVIFNNMGRNLILTPHAYTELCQVICAYPGIMLTVRFDGLQGARKASHWKFSVVTEDKKPEFSLSSVMGR